MDVNQTYYDFTVYTNIKWCCTTETNVMLYVNFDEKNNLVREDYWEIWYSDIQIWQENNTANDHQIFSHCGLKSRCSPGGISFELQDHWIIVLIC